MLCLSDNSDLIRISQRKQREESLLKTSVCKGSASHFHTAALVQWFLLTLLTTYLLVFFPMELKVAWGLGQGCVSLSVHLSNTISHVTGCHRHQLIWPEYGESQCKRDKESKAMLVAF